MATKEIKTKKVKDSGKEQKVKVAKVSKVSSKKSTRSTNGEKKPTVSTASSISMPTTKDNDKIVLRIRVRAYENKILDASVKQIIDTALRYDAVIVGPVPLPIEIKKYTVNRASFIYKNAREQFEIRVHKRLIDIINPNPKTVEALTNLSLPSGVDIDVKML